MAEVLIPPLAGPSIENGMTPFAMINPGDIFIDNQANDLLRDMNLQPPIADEAVRMARVENLADTSLRNPDNFAAANKVLAETALDEHGRTTSGLPASRNEREQFECLQLALDGTTPEIIQPAPMPELDPADSRAVQGAIDNALRATDHYAHPGDAPAPIAPYDATVLGDPSNSRFSEVNTYERMSRMYASRLAAWERGRDAAIKQLNVLLERDPRHADAILHRVRVEEAHQANATQAHGLAQAEAGTAQDAADEQRINTHNASAHLHTPERIAAQGERQRLQAELNAPGVSAARTAEINTRVAEIDQDAHPVRDQHLSAVQALIAAQYNSRNSADQSHARVAAARTNEGVSDRRMAGLQEVIAGLNIDEGDPDFLDAFAQIRENCTDTFQEVSTEAMNIPGLSDPTERATALLQVADLKQEMRDVILEIEEEMENTLAAGLSERGRTYRQLLYARTEVLRTYNRSHYLDLQLKAQTGRTADGVNFYGHRNVTVNPDKSYTDHTFRYRGGARETVDITYYPDGSVTQEEGGALVRRNPDASLWNPAQAPAIPENILNDSSLLGNVGRAVTRAHHAERKQAEGLLTNIRERNVMDAEWMRTYQRWFANQEDPAANAQMVQVGQRTHQRYEAMRAAALKITVENNTQLQAVTDQINNLTATRQPVPPELTARQTQLANFDYGRVAADVMAFTNRANATLYYSLLGRVGMPGNKVPVYVDGDGGIVTDATIMGHRDNWKVYPNGSTMQLIPTTGPARFRPGRSYTPQGGARP